ncbi:MAG: P1 family peptidase [Pseudomonadota bacterium]
MPRGANNLITDVRGLTVGNAQDTHLKSGVTVLTANQPFVASVHVMGGAPGTRETDLLAPDKTVEDIDALVLSGGSAFGLDACSGVADRLRRDGRGFAVGDTVVPIVPGAILFDLVNGGEKGWDENPYMSLGREAYENTRTNFDLGSVGAGCGALTARHKGGLGSASFVQESGVTVGALVAVNSIGAVTTPGERHFWAAPFELNQEFGGLGPDPASDYAGPAPSLKAAALGASDKVNTTIAIVATDAPLTKSQCHRMSVMAHDGLARAIVPSHTPMDGDLVFGLATGDRSGVDPVALAQIGADAATCLARAVARAVYEATPDVGDLLPCYRDQV